MHRPAQNIMCCQKLHLLLIQQILPVLSIGFRHHSLPFLNGKDGVESELDLGVGWQDPAIIRETGLCVWNSGMKPELHLKRNGDMLKGLMAIYYCEDGHDTPSIVDKNRNYDLIFNAGKVAHQAVIHEDLDK